MFRRGNYEDFDSYLMRAKLPKDTSEKVMTFDGFSPLNSGRRHNTYAKRGIKLGDTFKKVC